MAIKHSEEYRCRPGPSAGENSGHQPPEHRLMEVCGTHTVSIFRSGIRPCCRRPCRFCRDGCPVCVTDQAEIDAFIELARQKDVIVTTFGDLMRVPRQHFVPAARASGRPGHSHGLFDGRCLGHRPHRGHPGKQWCSRVGF